MRTSWKNWGCNCPAERKTQSLRNHPEEVASLVDLPPHVFAVFGLCVGYPNPDSAAVKPRLPQLAVLHRETYNLAEQDEAIANYNEVIKAFYSEQQMNISGDWSEHSANRVKSPQSLSGRDRLREALKNLGFELR